MSEEYEKDFDGWNIVKKRIEDNSSIPYFDIGEVWWCSLGVNVGVEINGKGNDYLRPVLILNKYNPLGCLIIPLSSVREIDKDNILIGVILDKTATANMSQIKSISSMRLVEKMVVIKKLNFINIQKAVMKYNFPLQLFDIPSPSIEESSPKADIN